MYTEDFNSVMCSLCVQGIHLFKNTPNGGTAYMYLQDTKDVEFAESKFENLPKLPGKVCFFPFRVSTRNLFEQKFDAPVVAEDGNFVLHDCTFSNNRGGELAGALLVGGSADVDIKGVRQTSLLSTPGHFIKG